MPIWRRPVPIVNEMVVLRLGMRPWSPSGIGRSHIISLSFFAILARGSGPNRPLKNGHPQRGVVPTLWPPHWGGVPDVTGEVHNGLRARLRRDQGVINWPC